jgi:hypothetical protein
MQASQVANDFKRAMSSIVLTAGAALADAERASDKAGTPSRKTTEQDLRLTKEFCRLLLLPVEEYGPGFAQIPGFAETYCRTHLSVATDFLRQAVVTHDSSKAELRRLTHIAGLIERNLKLHLDEKTAIRCWFGDRLP